MAHKIITSRGRFMVHISSSSIGLMAYDIININIWIGSSNESKLTAYITSLIFMESGFSNKSPYIHKMIVKPKVHHLIFGS